MKLISASPLNGTIHVPADKSISHRSIMFGAISEGTTTIKNFLRGEDCLSTLNAFKSLGVPITDDGETIRVTGVGFDGLKKPATALDLGNSGTTIRLMMGILAKQSFDTVLFGDEYLNKRPMNRVMLPLNQMNANLSGHDNSEYPPIHISANNQLTPITYHMPVASAQVKSAILFAALQADGETTIIEKEPTRNHTEEMIRQFGGTITTDGKNIRMTGPQRLVGQNVTVPGDISSAAFFLVAGAIVPNSAIVLKNVGINPTRTGILDVLEEMNADVVISEEDHANQSATLTVKTSSLTSTTISGDIIPRLIDEIPIIALLATQANGQTVIKNAEELKVKETNRIDATAEELRKLGADITPTEDGLIINGPCQLHGGNVSSRGDHRIGMMLQIAALLTDEDVVMEKSEAVSVSYPAFFEDVTRLSRGDY
ncbi:3-phosphoshikimate 1-carboxyvinyltransferase [Melissococcus sp. OM08-11BH]|uniref:3-phosphoshikimate 1-carboxyvinyltransferase n=1 Tax=Melissococcus sp. OM08-11BH TaxID=2293110 RepID=UPI000E4F4C66|nr:3-phosphoshikimate 1-carboxyvinyltransferase [Melissococcus sp. OM08-11BH]RGI31989.1 3-phosphoshikimate 1-carboxyvinyltransferase [Melissococcus sp. OM08-11BH]